MAELRQELIADPHLPEREAEILCHLPVVMIAGENCGELPDTAFAEHFQDFFKNDVVHRVRPGRNEVFPPV